MPAVKTDLTIEQGATWSHGWAVTYNGSPIDATWTARSQVRKSHTSPEPLHQFAPTVTAEGVVLLAATAVESSAWTWDSGVYDVEVEDADATVTLRVTEGRVTLRRELTR